MIVPSTLEADFAQLAEAGELGTAGAGRRRRDVMNSPGRAGELRQAAEQGRGRRTGPGHIQAGIGDPDERGRP
jgi:hypothetical protein